MMHSGTSFGAALDQTYARLRAGLAAKPRDYAWRMAQLRALRRMLVENEPILNAAMWADLRKSPFECAASEQGMVVVEIDDALKRLKRWMRPERVGTPLYNQPGRSEIYREPLGLTLIVGAWNYPINLTLAPLVGAIAGGNAALIKPSEVSARTAQAIAELVPRYLDPELFAVVLGGAPETTEILQRRYDLIFFTGSGAVGKIILQSAAPHLTPVILELGGKSPAVVASDADLAVAARRIAWGKFINAGQTCVAPDYVLAARAIKPRLIEELRLCIREFYGEDPRLSPDYCRIVNEKNFDRLRKLAAGLPALVGGQAERSELYIAPTVVDASADAPIMQEEIFGPILPVLEIESARDAIPFIQARPKPLALYVFTGDARLARAFRDQTSSGALCVNDVIIHMTEPELPFGGVGPSGMGQYHGKFSFDAFTHAKGVLKKSFWFDAPVRYPPYTDFKAKALRWLMG